MDKDLPGRERVATVTWALFDNSEELGPIMLAYEGEDAGNVMLQLIRRNPEAVKDDFYDYVKSRPFKISRLILSGFSNPASIDELKESYLSFVNNYAENVGHYPIAHTTLSIMGVKE